MSGRSGLDPPQIPLVKFMQVHATFMARLRVTTPSLQLLVLDLRASRKAVPTLRATRMWELEVTVCDKSSRTEICPNKTNKKLMANSSQGLQLMHGRQKGR
jgi:hypothetical protein